VFRFLIDTDNDGVADAFPGGKPGGAFNTAAINGTPVAGNFDGIAANGDEVGIFDGTTWYLDGRPGPGVRDFNVTLAEGVTSPIRGLPIVGDFNGDGFEDLATFNDFRNRFEIDLATGHGVGFGQINVVLLFGFPGTNDQPVAADINQDGVDDLGLFAPQQGAGTPDEQGFFHLLITQGALPLWNVTAANEDQAIAVGVPTDLVGNPAAAGVISVQLNFKPIPFGNDTLAIFGEDFAVPLLGNFDPPVGPGIGTPEEPVGGGETDTNPRNTLDVDDDGTVSVRDVVAVVSAIRTAGGPYEAPRDNMAPYPDVNANGIVSVQDLLPIIEYLRSPENQGSGEGETENSGTQLFVGVALNDQGDDGSRAAAVADVADAPDSGAIDAVAADVAAATPSGEPVNLSDDETDEMEDAIDAIIGDLVSA
jgi:hypothetical protein